MTSHGSSGRAGFGKRNVPRGGDYDAIEALYASASEGHPIDKPDAWGSLAEFRRAIATG